MLLTIGKDVLFKPRKFVLLLADVRWNFHFGS